MEHIESCFQLEKEPCIAIYSMHSEKVGEHWWSGWSGAYCMKCLEEDKDELCISTGCECPCHAEFWDAYNKSQIGNEPGVMEDDVRFGTPEEQGEKS